MPRESLVAAQAVAQVGASPAGRAQRYTPGAGIKPGLANLYPNPPSRTGSFANRSCLVAGLSTSRAATV